ncbi:3-hydroxyacyl-CoA dehydrogenase type-2-like [Montipora foliosa]|uniref:3-hydroxyacyl-CoA dehydrogenase type-2-like n=1 Tax=Montipora foliosa TaxID=591990 RepID=UPI0035F1F853
MAVVRGRVGCLVAGGASGLGLATVHRLVKNGCRVVIADLPSSEGERVARDLGENCTFVPTNVVSESDVKQAIKAVVEKCGPLRAVVNTAGIVRIAETLSHASEAHPLSLFEEIIKVNLMGTFNVARLAAQQMATNDQDEGGERGVIINTSSVHGYDGQAGKVAYSTTKGGINAMTLPMARDLAQYGIRVNAIAPGLFLTPMLLKARPEPSQQESAAKIIPFPKRIADPADFAQLVQAIMENKMINGEIIRIDGAVRMP